MWELTSDDVQTEGYEYVVRSSGVANTYLMGAYKEPDYKANVYFLGVTYRF